MNIAIIIRSLGGGGAERVAQILGDYYVEKGDNVYYFLGDTPVKQAYSVKGKIINTGIKSCVSNNFFGDTQALIKLVKASFMMRKYKRKYKIDVAISFIEESNYLNVLSRGREKVITRVCIILSKCAACSGIFYNKNIVKFFYNMSDKIVVLCDDAINDMNKNYHIPIKKMVKIPNPVLEQPFCASEIDWKYGDKVIVAVGRLAQQKQHDRIIRAFSYVYEHDQEARLLILGEGPLEEYLKNLCERYHLKDKVIFAGFKSNIGDYLRKSQMFVMASESEGMPNSMLEAMAHGLPVVTTDTPGACAEILGKPGISGKCRDIEHCTYGILTPYITGSVRIGSPLEREEILLGEAMLELISDEEKRKKYSERSFKRASMYNLEKIMKKWNRLVK